MKVLVLSTKVPFVHGGAEELFHHLVQNLRKAGVEAEGFSLPFTWHPAERLIEEMVIAKHLRLANVDRVIALKFPAYLVPWENKIVWLLHQYRQAYDLLDAGQSNIPEGPRGQQIVDAIRAADTQALSGARHLYTIAPTTAGRLRRYNGLASTVLRHPLNDPELFFPAERGDYILATGRVTQGKRQHLLVSALRHSPKTRLVIAGPVETPATVVELQELAAREGVSDRVTFDLRFLPREELARLVNGARAVAYIPYDEDSIGYCTMEAFQAHKPVLTTTDAGGVLDIVVDDVTGLVAEPNAKALGRAMARLSRDEVLCERLGDAGADALAREDLNWPATIEKLLS